MKIAIDGPSGVGKSETAKLLAKKLDILHVNAGSMFRAYALYFIRNNYDCNDEKLIEKVYKNAKIELKYVNKTQQTILNGEVVDSLLRTEEISVNSAIISQYPFIRESVVQVQRDLSKTTNVVIEGRDICSVVLPDAEFKFFLTASPEIRAKRRYLQLKNQGANTTFEEVLKDIEKRDYYDTHRKVSPLIQTKDSVLINTDNMTLDEVTSTILDYINKKGN